MHQFQRSAISKDYTDLWSPKTVRMVFNLINMKICEIV